MARKAKYFFLAIIIIGVILGPTYLGKMVIDFKRSRNKYGDLYYTDIYHTTEHDVIELRVADQIVSSTHFIRDNNYYSLILESSTSSTASLLEVNLSNTIIHKKDISIIREVLPYNEQIRYSGLDYQNNLFWTLQHIIMSNSIDPFNLISFDINGDILANESLDPKLFNGFENEGENIGKLVGVYSGYIYIWIRSSTRNISLI